MEDEEVIPSLHIEMVVIVDPIEANMAEAIPTAIPTDDVIAWVVVEVPTVNIAENNEGSEVLRNQVFEDENKQVFHRETNSSMGMDYQVVNDL